MKDKIQRPCKICVAKLQAGACKLYNNLMECKDYKDYIDRYDHRPSWEKHTKPHQ